MAGDTKERILETALELFAQSGYLGTSMSDIAGGLGITKGALYKHYTSKQEILDSIVERMNKMDYERAEEYEMPETEPDGFAEAYIHTPIEKIRTYSMAQFDHWTKEHFPANFRLGSSKFMAYSSCTSSIRWVVSSAASTASSSQRLL